MATVDSSSTLAQVQNAFDDACSWVEDKSIAKARALVTAGTILLRRVPSTAAKGSNALSNSNNEISKAIAEARKYIQAHDAAQLPGPLVTKPSFQMSRG
jgi:hypothetical protein